MYNSHIQGVPGEKINILGRHIIRHSKQQNVYVHVWTIPNGFRDRTASL
jgi:hypothetical protein